MLFLNKRTEKEIWQNLFDFKLQELKDEKSFLKTAQRKSTQYKTTTTTHKLSHQHISALFILKPTTKQKKIGVMTPIKFPELKKLPVPTLIKTY